MAKDLRLAISNVGKFYRVEEERREVLREIDFAVEPGEFVSVIGPSGCGKSTLLRLVVGLDDDYDGHISLGGRRIDGPGEDRGIVFQDHRLLPWLTVEQNVALGLDAAGLPRSEIRAIVRAHLDIVRLGDFARAYPHQLSGGMAQRAAIARALVTRPALLLMDEPLGALDSQTRAAMQDELQRIRRAEQASVLMVTHDIEEAVYLSDKVVVMDARPGRVRAVIAVDLPEQRDRAAQRFLALKERVLAALQGAAPAVTSAVPAL